MVAAIRMTIDFSKSNTPIAQQNASKKERLERQQVNPRDSLVFASSPCPPTAQVLNPHRCDRQTHKANAIGRGHPKQCIPRSTTRFTTSTHDATLLTTKQQRSANLTRFAGLLTAPHKAFLRAVHRYEVQSEAEEK